MVWLILIALEARYWGSEDEKMWLLLLKGTPSGYTEGPTWPTYTRRESKPCSSFLFDTGSPEEHPGPYRRQGKEIWGLDDSLERCRKDCA